MPIDNKHMVQLRSVGHVVNPLLFGYMEELPIISKATELLNNSHQAAQSDSLILGTENGLRRLLIQIETYKNN